MSSNTPLNQPLLTSTEVSQYQAENTPHSPHCIVNMDEVAQAIHNQAPAIVAAPPGERDIESQLPIGADPNVAGMNAFSESLSQFLHEKIQKAMEGNESLTTQVIVNWVRDFTWEYLSRQGTDIMGHPTGAIDFSSFQNAVAIETFGAQTLGQWAWSSLALSTAGLITLGVCKQYNIAVDAKAILTHVVGASLSIPLWNFGANLGTWLGTEMGLSQYAAGFFPAPLLTGLFEGGLVQYPAQLISKWIRHPEEFEKFKQDPMTTLKEFGLNCTIGAIPGATWQIVAAAMAHSNPVLAAFGVAMAVAAANACSAKAIQHIMQQELQPKPESFKPIV